MKLGYLVLILLSINSTFAAEIPSFRLDALSSDKENEPYFHVLSFSRVKTEGPGVTFFHLTDSMSGISFYSHVDCYGIFDELKDPKEIAAVQEQKKIILESIEAVKDPRFLSLFRGVRFFIVDKRKAVSSHEFESGVTFNDNNPILLPMSPFNGANFKPEGVLSVQMTFGKAGRHRVTQDQILRAIDRALARL